MNILHVHALILLDYMQSVQSKIPGKNADTQSVHFLLSYLS